jgi:hypothetical protein
MTNECHWISVNDRLPSNDDDLLLFVVDDGESLSGILFLGWFKEGEFHEDVSACSTYVTSYDIGGADGVHFWMRAPSRSGLFSNAANASQRYE